MHTLCLLGVMTPTPVSAEVLSFLNTENGRAALDISTRAVLNDGDRGSIVAVGLDTHRVLSRPDGDIATLTLQPYLVVANIAPSLSNQSLQVSGEEVLVDWRVSNLNLKLAPRGLANLRLGHFEVPFGLEQVIQTAGTLNEMNARFNSGRKADWGASINGLAHNLEYEFSWLTGPKSSKGFFAGRIGRSRNNDWWVGVSGLDGDTNIPSRPSNDTVERSRWGIDGGIQLTSGLHLLADIAAGRDDGERVTHALIEGGYRNRNEKHLAYLQFRVGRIKTSNDTLDSNSLTIGYRYEPGARLVTSFEYRYVLQDILEPSQFTAQLRLRI